MKNLSSLSLWIVILLAVTLLFMNYSRQDAPEKIDLLKWRELGLAGQLKTATDHGGKIEGEYTTPDGQAKKYQTNYFDFQSSEILKWVAEANSASNGK